MIEWNKYIKWGKFISTHGVELPFKWEFNRLEMEERDKNIIIAAILAASFRHDLVIISTYHPKELRNFADIVYYPKTNSFARIKKVRKQLNRYVIYDDVVTTGKSMINCIQQIGFCPEYCLCLMDRRMEALKSISDKGWDLDIISIGDILNC